MSLSMDGSDDFGALRMIDLETRQTKNDWKKRTPRKEVTVPISGGQFIPQAGLVSSRRTSYMFRHISTPLTLQKGRFVSR